MSSSRIPSMRFQSVREGLDFAPDDAFEVARFFMSACFAHGDDTNGSRSFRICRHQDSPVQDPRRDEARLAVVETHVEPRDDRPLEKPLAVPEVEPVLPEIRKTLLLAPLEIHGRPPL